MKFGQKWKPAHTFKLAGIRCLEQRVRQIPSENGRVVSQFKSLVETNAMRVVVLVPRPYQLGRFRQYLKIMGCAAITYVEFRTINLCDAFRYAPLSVHGVEEDICISL